MVMSKIYSLCIAILNDIASKRDVGLCSIFCYVFPCLLTGHMQNRGGKGA